MVVENSNSIKVGQQCLRCNNTKFTLKMLIFFRNVLIFQEDPIFGQFYYRNDRERNGTLTGMCRDLWKTYQ